MSLNNYTPLTKENNIKEMTEYINRFGEEFSKPRNIFEVVSELQVKTDGAQLKNLTTDKGLAKTPLGTRILDVKEAGVYYYSAGTLATKTDKPEMNSQDVVMVVTPTNNTSIVVQTMYPLTSSDNAIQYVYRVVIGNTAGEWVYQKGLVGGINTTIGGMDVDNFTRPGEYFIDNATGLPSGEKEGMLKVYKGDRNNIIYEFTSSHTGFRYHKITNIPGEWIKELEPESLSKYTLGDITDDGYTTFGVTLYKEDNISFQKAVRDHIIETGQPTFTFYVQGGVEGNPNGGGACRGIFVSDTSRLGEGVQALHGVYYAISTVGNIVTGSVSGDDWRIPKGVDSSNTLWTGVKELTSKTAEKMEYSSNDFDYFKIFVTIGSSTGDAIYRVGQEFGKHSANKYSISGVCVPLKGSTLEYYRIDISFNGNTFKIDNWNTKTGAKSYVTEIVGIRRPI